MHAFTMAASQLTDAEVALVGAGRSGTVAPSGSTSYRKVNPSHAVLPRSPRGLPSPLNVDPLAVHTLGARRWAVIASDCGSVNRRPTGCSRRAAVVGRTRRGLRIQSALVAGAEWGPVGHQDRHRPFLDRNGDQRPAEWPPTRCTLVATDRSDCHPPPPHRHGGPYCPWTI
jgi:hypothetical protein